MTTKILLRTVICQLNYRYFFFLVLKSKRKHYKANPGQAISLCIKFLKAKTNKE